MPKTKERGVPIGPKGTTISSRDVKFSDCQAKAYDQLASGKNLFLTGYAGTGKSFLISEFLKTQSSREEFPVLASTGAAAVLIHGRTFHSFFGLGIFRGGLEETVKQAVKNRRVRKRICKARTVIIDEVSMLSGEALEAAEEIARSARESREPWGGLQVIVVGDFAQLPPISRGAARPWAFLHPVWQQSHFSPIILQTSIRTRDPEFMMFLNTIREGTVTEEAASFLESRKADSDLFDGTRLFPLREATEKFNRQKLDSLSGKLDSFPTEYKLGKGREFNLDSIKSQFPFPETLYLKLGAQVMIRVNDPLLRYVNGTVGKVVTIQPATVTVDIGKERVDFVRESFSILDGDGKELATATNFPITLAWASTIHKAQGTTLGKVLLDLDRLWEPGQAYVALSRARDPRDVFVLRWSRESFRSDPLVTEFYRQGCPSDFCDQTFDSTAFTASG